MRKKVLFVVICILLIVGTTLCFLLERKNSKAEEVEFTEYTPQEEISENQERKTLVTLYFINSRHKRNYARGKTNRCKTSAYESV